MKIKRTSYKLRTKETFLNSKTIRSICLKLGSHLQYSLYKHVHFVSFTKCNVKWQLPLHCKVTLHTTKSKAQAVWLYTKKNTSPPHTDIKLCGLTLAPGKSPRKGARLKDTRALTLRGKPWLRREGTRVSFVPSDDSSWASSGWCSR